MYTTKLTDRVLQDVHQDVRALSLANGIGFSVSDKENKARSKFQALKLCMLPSPIPAKWFFLAKDIQPSINLMIHRIANCRQFMENALSDSISSNEFIGRLFRIYIKAREHPSHQRVSLGLFRTDYMLNDDPQALQQIEVNTISASLSGFAPKVTSIHRYIMNKYDLYAKSDQYIPVNNATLTFSQGLVEAWRYYNNELAVILVVVAPYESNIADQKFTEIEALRLQPKLKFLYRKFDEIAGDMHLGPNNELIVQNQEVAVVYYRTGYTLACYAQSEHAWKVRELAELSNAVKCPPISYQLAGTKMVQRALSTRPSVDKFLSAEEKSAEVHSTYAESYHIRRNREGDKALVLGLSHPDKYVLKYEEEGGGNNFFGEDMVKKLRAIESSDERSSFTLMRLIRPKPQRNYSLTDDNLVISGEMIGELGIYGAILADEGLDQPLMNIGDGFVLKSKLVGVNEGGICAGYSAIDSIILE